MAAPASASWLDHQYYTIQRIGFFGAEHTGSTGLQNSAAEHFNAAGVVIGYSVRSPGLNTNNGADAWIWNGTTTTQLGFTGAGYTGSAGYQSSSAFLLNAAGQVAGYSVRVVGAGGSDGFHGRDAWVWNGTATTQIGLTGVGYTSVSGFRHSVPAFQNAAGQVAGFSDRYTGESTNTGRDAWAWTGSTTTRIGLAGSANTTSTGYRYSEPTLQSAIGRVAGYSERYTSAGASNGRDAWVWDGSTTTQIGFAGGSNTGSAGYQYSEATLQNGAGKTVGYSVRYTGVNLNNGRDAWVWDGSTTTQIGFAGGPNTGSAGRRYSEAKFQNEAGQVVGYSERYTGVNVNNGRDAWVWNGSTTTQIGFTGAGYTDNSGLQYSDANLQNEAGQVAGFSRRYTVFGTNTGRDAWVWNGTTTTQIGLLGAVYTNGSNRSSEPTMQNEAGQVAGYSARYTGFTNIGHDAWVWNGTMTTQIGLTGAGYTGSAGYQSSDPVLQNSAGQVAGYSERISGLTSNNGRDVWVWNGLTTVRAGLTGADYTGTTGRQYSELMLQNAAGQVAGYSQRITDQNTYRGDDAWYFDPITQTTYAIIGSVRPSDNYAYSRPSILTDGGFLLGSYKFYGDGAIPVVQRAFVFRPDLGFTDLGDLVNGGLTLNGWSTLLQPQFADALNTIVGYGYVNGQTTGQSVFVMSIPAPGAAGLLGLCGVIATRRRRMSA